MARGVKKLAGELFLQIQGERGGPVVDPGRQIGKACRLSEEGRRGHEREIIGNTAADAGLGDGLGMPVALICAEVVTPVKVQNFMVNHEERIPDMEIADGSLNGITRIG